MKAILIFLLSLNVFAENSGIYDFELKGARGKELNLSQYKGKTLLFVNIATKCGYTPQLDDLEVLYQKYKEQGLVIVGIPTNDFGSQTPEENKEVAEFCRLNYGVTFPLTAKMVVKGESRHEFAKYLLSNAKISDIKWNFEKFLYNSEGSFVARFPSSTKPLDSKLEASIKKSLK